MYVLICLNHSRIFISNAVHKRWIRLLSFHKNDVNLAHLSKGKQPSASVCCKHIHDKQRCGPSLHYRQGYRPLICARLSKVTLRAKVNTGAYQTGKIWLSPQTFLCLWSPTTQTLLGLSGKTALRREINAGGRVNTTRAICHHFYLNLKVTKVTTSTHITWLQTI